MSTPANIAELDKQGRLHIANVAMDGDPNVAGAILYNAYHDPAKVHRLVKLGNLDHLGYSTKPANAVKEGGLDWSEHDGIGDTIPGTNANGEHVSKQEASVNRRKEDKWFDQVGNYTKAFQRDEGRGLDESTVNPKNVSIDPHSPDAPVKAMAGSERNASFEGDYNYLYNASTNKWYMNETGHRTVMPLKNAISPDIQRAAAQDYAKFKRNPVNPHLPKMDQGQILNNIHRQLYGRNKMDTASVRSQIDYYQGTIDSTRDAGDQPDKRDITGLKRYQMKAKGLHHLGAYVQTHPDVKLYPSDLEHGERTVLNLKAGRDDGPQPSVKDYLSQHKDVADKLHVHSGAWQQKWVKNLFGVQNNTAGYLRAHIASYPHNLANKYMSKQADQLDAKAGHTEAVMKNLDPDALYHDNDVEKHVNSGSQSHEVEPVSRQGLQSIADKYHFGQPKRTEQQESIAPNGAQPKMNLEHGVESSGPAPKGPDRTPFKIPKKAQKYLSPFDQNTFYHKEKLATDMKNFGFLNDRQYHAGLEGLKADLGGHITQRLADLASEQGAYPDYSDMGDYGREGVEMAHVGSESLKYHITKPMVDRYTSIINTVDQDPNHISNLYGSFKSAAHTVDKSMHVHHVKKSISEHYNDMYHMNGTYRKFADKRPRKREVSLDKDFGINDPAPYRFGKDDYSRDMDLKDFRSGMKDYLKAMDYHVTPKQLASQTHDFDDQAALNYGMRHKHFQKEYFQFGANDHKTWEQGVKIAHKRMLPDEAKFINNEQHQLYPEMPEAVPVHKPGRVHHVSLSRMKRFMKVEKHANAVSKKQITQAKVQKRQTSRKLAQTQQAIQKTRAQQRQQSASQRRQISHNRSQNGPSLIKH